MSKISELSDGGVIQGGDTLIAVRSGGNVKVTYGGTTTANIDGGTIDGTVIGGTTPAAGNFTTVTADGLSVGDNQSITLGTSSDLRLKHTGLASYIADEGAGDLNLVSNAAAVTLGIGTIASSSTILSATSSGIDVTGTANADKITTSNVDAANFTSTGSTYVDLNNGTVTGRLQTISSDFFIGTATTGTSLAFKTNNVERLRINSIGDISFYEDTGTTAKLVWKSSDERLGIGTTSPARPLTVNGLIGSRNSTTGFGSSDGFDIGVGGSDAYLVQRENANIIIETNGSEAMRIDSSGNVGIGTANPQSKLQVDGTFTATGNIFLHEATASSSNAVEIGRNRTVDGAVFLDLTASTTEGDFNFRLNRGSGTNGALQLRNRGTGAMEFLTNDSEAMRIDSNGTSFFGLESETDTPTNGGVYINGDRSVGSTNSFPQLFVVHDSSVNHGIIVKELGSTGVAMQTLNSSGTIVGSITTTNSATSYNISSDHRLKENVVAMTGATARLKQLSPKRFNFIVDSDTTVDGFLAHEVQSVVPEAITGTHNEVDDDGNPVYQGIDQSKLVPLLVATIQELEARIAALESN